MKIEIEYNNENDFEINLQIKIRDKIITLIAINASRTKKYPFFIENFSVKNLYKSYENDGYYEILRLCLDLLLICVANQSMARRS